MKNFPKAGLLIVTLVIPALIFVMLRLFATNHYILPFYNPELASDGKGKIVNGDTVFQKRSEISAISGKHKLGNEITLLSFLPKDCGDSCKLVLANLERMYAMRSGSEKLTIVTVMADSSALSKNYPENLGQDGWKVVLATEAETSEIMESKSAAGVKSPELYAGENRLVLIDDKGYTRGYYNGADADDVDRLMAEVKILNYENKASANP